MIQRIQTIWLLLAALIMSGIFYFPVYKFTQGINVTIGNDYLAIALTVLSIILSLVAIFSFKNRKNQVRFCWLNILVCLGLLAWLFYSVNNAVQAQSVSEGAGGYYWVGAFLPLAAIVLLLMGRSAIRKDEKLIKSMDRLR